MVEVHPYCRAVHVLPNVVHCHVQDSLTVLGVNGRHVVQQDLDGRPPIRQLSGHGLLIENDEASYMSIVVLHDVLGVLQHKDVQVQAIHGLTDQFLDGCKTASLCMVQLAKIRFHFLLVV